MSQRVLVVEDDHGLRDVLARGLREHGYAVTTATDGASALRSAGDVDVVVLDIGLPDADGRDVCQAMRARGISVPVLFLTARGGVTDRLSGFAVGGDDYLAKPFHLAELVARLQVALRRSGSTTEVSLDGLTLDPATHSLVGEQETVHLTPTEFRLLAKLMAEPGVVVRRHELLAAAWAHGSHVADNTLDQYVAKLRRKLADVGTERRIETARGIGYRLS
ncbi:MAG: response regulator transcription factor [Actinomycetes bacterium]